MWLVSYFICLGLPRVVDDAEERMHAARRRAMKVHSLVAGTSDDDSDEISAPMLESEAFNPTASAAGESDATSADLVEMANDGIGGDGGTDDGNGGGDSSGVDDGETSSSGKSHDVTHIGSVLNSEDESEAVSTALLTGQLSSAQDDQVPSALLTTKQRARVVLSLWPFMVPLTVVYFSEYAIQSGVRAPRSDAPVPKLCQ
jgi:hypothetical protein